MIRKYRLFRFAGIVAGLIVAIGLGIGQSKFARATSADADEPSGPAQDLASQVKQLQQQLAELKKQVSEANKSRIVAAGTATYIRPANQDNKSFSRVKLSADIASKLGEDYVVLLTNHFPTGGYPYFDVYWK